ncbi:MAG: response regulator, partial [Nitrospirota bacterium]
MQKYNILVVDDEKNILKVVSLTLKDHGYGVETAQSVEEALSKFRGGAFDLVVTDLKLPGRSGGELLAEIKAGQPDFP